MENPYTPPQSSIVAPPPSGSPNEYATFWARLAAWLIDGILLSIVTAPLTFLAYGAEGFTSPKPVKGVADVVINWVIPIFYFVYFWHHKGATPGKMMLKIKIIAASGGRLSLGQCFGRYFAYILSALGLLLGYLWVLWDPKKQGWHDKLAGTYVVRS